MIRQLFGWAVAAFRAVFSIYSRNSVKLPRYVRRAMGQRGYLTAIVTRDGRIIPMMAGAAEDALDKNEILQALGIGEADDPIAAIGNLRDRIKELETTLASDAQGTDKAALAQLRRDLSEAEKNYLKLESDMNKRIIELEETNRREKAERMVDAAIAQGRVQPALKETALKLALRDPADFEEFAAKLPGIDLTERGVASDADLLELEPTATELQIGAQMGLTRADLMRQKASDKGVKLPPEFGKEKTTSGAGG